MERVHVGREAPSERLEEVALLLQKRYAHVAESLDALHHELTKLRLGHEVLQSLVLMEQSGQPASSDSRLPLQARPASLGLCSAQVSAPKVTQTHGLNNTAVQRQKAAIAYRAEQASMLARTQGRSAPFTGSRARVGQPSQQHLRGGRNAWHGHMMR